MGILVSQPNKWFCKKKNLKLDNYAEIRPSIILYCLIQNVPIKKFIFYLVKYDKINNYYYE